MWNLVTHRSDFVVWQDMTQTDLFESRPRLYVWSDLFDAVEIRNTTWKKVVESSARRKSRQKELEGVRKLIEQLDNCPGRNDFKLVIPGQESPDSPTTPP